MAIQRIMRGTPVWTHHPRGGITTGFAGQQQYALERWERGIAATVEDAKQGNCFTFAPVSQVYRYPLPAAK